MAVPNCQITVSNQPFGEPRVPHYPRVRRPTLEVQEFFKVRGSEEPHSKPRLFMSQGYLKGQSSPPLTGAGENAYLSKNACVAGIEHNQFQPMTFAVSRPTIRGSQFETDSSPRHKLQDDESLRKAMLSFLRTQLG